jgi:hypothetical protein
MYRERRSLRAIARALEERGIRSRTGRTFAPIQIKRMVANPRSTLEAA